MKVVPRYNLLYKEFLCGESLAQGASLGACPGDVHDGEGGQGRGDLVPHVSEGVGPVLPQNVVCPGAGSRCTLTVQFTLQFPSVGTCSRGS